jgi:hypothetical protein
LVLILAFILSYLPHFFPVGSIATVNWALQHAEILDIEVPGPHPCLATLLETGFRIAYVDTFVSSSQTPFFDAHRYIPSGGDLF